MVSIAISLHCENLKLHLQINVSFLDMVSFVWMYFICRYVCMYACIYLFIFWIYENGQCM